MDSPGSARSKRPTAVMQQVAPYMALGTQLSVTVLFLGGMGWLADNHWNSTPWGLIVGLCLGSVVGFVQFLRSVKRLLAADAKRKT